LTQGMVCMETYNCPEHEWLYPDQVSEDMTCLICGSKVQTGRIEKMSKSKKNVVDPDEMVNTYGADAMRVFVLFAGPPEKDMEWTEGGIDGASKYLQRVWRMAYKWHDRIRKAGSVAADPSGNAREYSDHQRRLRRRTHQTIRSITENFEERLHLNTCISSLMELTNEIYLFDQAVEKSGDSTETDAQVVRESFEALLKMLVPFAPHIAEELWEVFGHSEGLIKCSWPEFDPALTQEEEIEVPVQINGKLRSRVYVGASAGEEEMKTAALEEEKIKAALEGRDVVKVIVVPRKLVNVVVR
jgi:leucyl-tRNA synthetase